MDENNFSLLAKAASLLNEGDLLAAATCYKTVLARSPSSVQATIGLARSLIYRGIPQEALSYLDRLPPCMVPASLLAECFIGLRRWQDALVCLTKPDASGAKGPEQMLQLGRLYRQLEDRRRARQFFEGVCDTPLRVSALCELGELAFEEGDDRSARMFASSALQLQPTCPRAVWLQYLCHVVRGNLLAARRLFDTERDVHIIDLPETPYNDSATEQLCDLKNTFCKEETLVWEPCRTTTRRGWQTMPFLADKRPEAYFLKQLIFDATLTFRTEFRVDAFAVHASQREKFDLRLWAVILAQHGHQNPHLHDTALFSGVLYLTSMAEHPHYCDDSGCLEMGSFYDQVADGKYPLEVSKAPIKLIKPIAGRLVVFPSYARHRTVPHCDREFRVSVAFDFYWASRVSSSF